MKPFDGLISRLLPRKKTAPADRPKSMDPTTLRVGVDGDDAGRIVFIIEDTETGDQFAHVSLTPDDATAIADAIYGMVMDISEAREFALQKDEAAATEAFREHAAKLAALDAKHPELDDAYAQLARDADKRLMAKLAAQATMYGDGDASRDAAIDAVVRGLPTRETRPDGAVIVGDDPATVGSDPIIDAKKAAFKETLRRMVEAVQQEEAEHGPIAQGDDPAKPGGGKAGMSETKPG